MQNTEATYGTGIKSQNEMYHYYTPFFTKIQAFLAKMHFSRVQIPPAPPEKRIGILYEYRFFFISTMSFQSRNIESLQLGHALI